MKKIGESYGSFVADIEICDKKNLTEKELLSLNLTLKKIFNDALCEGFIPEREEIFYCEYFDSNKHVFSTVLLSEIKIDNVEIYKIINNIFKNKVKIKISVLTTGINPNSI